MPRNSVFQKNTSQRYYHENKLSVFMHPILKAHIEKGEFHHAYLLCGDREICLKTAEETAKAILANNNLEAHPDFSRGNFDLFSINDSRNLIHWASTKSFSGRGKVFVMEISSFNAESSNALLKIMEDPGEKIHFFIIVSSIENIIPTLQSRMAVIGGLFNKEEMDKKSVEDGRNFLAALPKKRMEMISKMLVKKDDDSGKEIITGASTNKQKAVKFVNILEFLLEKELRQKDLGIKCSNASKQMALKEIYRSGQFLPDSGSSPKIILEHLALTLPNL